MNAPERRLIAGVILILTALLLMIAAWGGLTLLSGARRATPPAALPPAGASVTGAPATTGPVTGDLSTAAPGAATPIVLVPSVPPPTGATTGLPATAAPTGAAPVVVPSAVDIDGLLDAMPLEAQIGQLIMTGVSGASLDAQTAALIRARQAGSVVYFGDNTPNAEAVRRLSLDLQAAAGWAPGAPPASGVPLAGPTTVPLAGPTTVPLAGPTTVPLLIAIDHEGGSVHRFKEGLTHFPNPMTLGAANSPELAAAAAAVVAAELRAVGINLDLGPVLDVNDEPLNPVIGVRALAGLPDVAARIGAAYVRGLQANGVIAAVKHFPGHGSTTVDSHAALPVIAKSAEQLAAHELVPFRAAIDAGAGVVMIGHIALPQIDPSRAPASLSAAIIEGILRQNMGFNGVVMTDALSMGAVEGYTPDEAAVRALLAGNDLLAYTSPQSAAAAHAALLAAARSGRIPAERIRQSARRVLDLKRRFGLWEAPPPGPIDLALGRATVERLSAAAITAHVGGSPPGAAALPALPLLSTGGVLLLTPDSLPPGSVAGDGLSLLGERLQGRGLAVDEWIYPLDNEAGIAVMQRQALQAAASRPGGGPVVVVLTDARLRRDAWGSPAQAALLDAFQSAGLSPGSAGAALIVAAAGSPFDLALLRPGVVGLATYGAQPAQIAALADALLAPSAPPGVLPVALR